jgi:N-carbamoyl-L-amino-acid hydrolase
LNGSASPAPSGSAAARSPPIFEAHIEQGPILDAAGLPIGVVTGTQGQRWYEVTVTGQEAHAGPTPIPRRRDALMIDAVNRIGHAHAPNACATIGFVEVSPNNTIPGPVFFTVDFRHPGDAVLAAMDQELWQTCDVVAAAANGLDVEVKEFWYFPPTPFDPALMAAVRASAAAQGYPYLDIIGGAWHDAVYMARIAPTAMIFVPCVDGISHSEVEDAKPDYLTAGCNVFLNAVLDPANATARPSDLSNGYASTYFVLHVDAQVSASQSVVFTTLETNGIGVPRARSACRSPWHRRPGALPHGFLAWSRPRRLLIGLQVSEAVER